MLGLQLSMSTPCLTPAVTLKDRLEQFVLYSSQERAKCSFQPWGRVGMGLLPLSITGLDSSSDCCSPWLSTACPVHLSSLTRLCPGTEPAARGGDDEKEPQGTPLSPPVPALGPPSPPCCPGQAQGSPPPLLIGFVRANYDRFGLN